MKTIHAFKAAMALAAVFALSAAARAVDLSNVKCPVSGKPAVEGHAVDFDGGKVYFCCEKCPVAFEKAQAKFAAKAAHQLAQTGQAKQANCPITGKPIDASKTVSVDGVDVAFCCAKCQAKVSKAAGDQQVNMCFGAAAFKKAYKVEK